VSPVSTYVALLRAVNVGGTGKLPMADLRRIAEDAGFTHVRTYIASGNLLVDADPGALEATAGSGERGDEQAADEGAVARVLEKALHEYAGKPVGVVVRTPGDLRRILEENPFPDAPGNRVAVIFLPAPPPADALAALRHADNGEEVRLGRRELYVHYPNGMGATKLVIPAAAQGTARNVNTIRALLDLTT
jgi:uncharacterized protein (DUF1697 family)